MSIISHLDALHTKHDAMEKRIEDAYLHHVSDVELVRLKKEKLKIKEEIHRYEMKMEEVA